MFHLNPPGGYNENIVEVNSGFSCRLCGKMFAKRFVCRRHIKEIHLGLGQSTCPYCGASVTRNDKARHLAACEGQQL